MPDVPYPITAENSEDLKRQVWELIREIFEERIGGLNIGDVFEDSGGILTLRLSASNPCLQKVANALQLEIKAASGLQATSTGVSIKLKSAGGLDVDSTGIFISSAGYGFGTFVCPAGTNPVAETANDTLTLAAGAGITITGNETTDTITIASTSWPIGSVFISVVATNPATLLGFGTWAAFGAGKVLVGLDATDTDFDTAEETGGAKTHLHAVDVGNTTSGTPSATATVDNDGALSTVAVGSGTHTHDVDPASVNSTTVSNVPPYIVCYFWKRTA